MTHEPRGPVSAREPVRPAGAKAKGSVGPATATDHKTARMTRGRPFQRGQSGNPAGRPRGSRNAATVAAEALLHGETEALTRKAIELAKSGDHFALRLCLERILPPTRERTVQFTLPPMTEFVDAPKAIAALLSAVANGELTPAEAGELSKLVEAFERAIQAKSLYERESLKAESNQPIKILYDQVEAKF
jgi:hypothetical protein